MFLPAWLSYCRGGRRGRWLRESAVRCRPPAGKAGCPRRRCEHRGAGRGCSSSCWAFIVWYLEPTRGVGFMFVFFVVLVVLIDYALTRTKWGRSVYAVGGNVEAARRAGIRVNRVFVSVFVLCSTLAALGGILAAARLARQPEQRRRRHQPQRDRGRGHRRHQPVRRPRKRVVGAAGHRRHPVDRQRADAAQPGLLHPLHGDRGRATPRRHHRRAIPAFPRVARSSLTALPTT